MIAFEFRDLHTDPPTLTHPHDAILGVVGTFEILIGDRLLFSEVDFPLVEFARAMFVWLRNIETSQEDFEYESMEAAESGLVWIRQEGEGWRIGSIAQEYPEMTAFSVADINSAFEDFIGRLEEKCRVELDLEISELLEHAA